MSIQTKLYVDDKVYGVLESTLSYNQPADSNGRPHPQVFGGLFNIVMESTKDDLFTAWATHPTMMKHVKIVQTPIAMDGKSRTFELIDTHCIFDKNHFNGTSKEPMKNYITLSPAILRLDGKLIHEKHWKVTDLNAKNVAPITRQEPETQIINIEWLNAESKEKIEKIDYSEKISLTAQIENPQGTTAKITIEKEDGTEFESGKKQLSFEEAIAEDGSIKLAELLVEEVWEENKKASVDKLIATIEHNGIKKKSSPLKLIPPPKVIADFREADKYDGEYGFDYMRDKKEKKDNLTYKDILGTNKDVSGSNVFTKYPTDAKYNSLKDDHYTTLTFPWYKDSAGKEIEYLQSWLTIYPGDTQNLSLQLDTLDNPEKLDLEFDYDKTLFKLSTDVIPAQGNGKKRLKDHFTIECLNEFDTDQAIKVLYKKRQLGQLMVLKNDKVNRKKVEVVFVKVRTELDTGTKLVGNTKNKTGALEKEMLNKYLRQSFVLLDHKEELFEMTQLDLTTKKLKYPDFNKNYTLMSSGSKILNKYSNTTGGDSLAEYMEKVFNKANPIYKDYFKVFFFGDSGGRKKTDGSIVGLAGYAKDFNTLSAIMFSGKREATVTHELLHCAGLRHSFDNSADYGYEKNATENIMDYSTKRKHIWLWQWKQLWENKNIKKE